MYYSKENVYKFYTLVSHVDFNSLSIERANEIDAQVLKYSYYFHNKTCGPLDLINFTAEKMRVSNKYYGIYTPEEMAYFFIKMIDPSFLALEAYEAGNTLKEQREISIKNLYYYSLFIIRLEEKINDRFNFYKQDEMCFLERVRR